MTTPGPLTAARPDRFSGRWWALRVHSRLDCRSVCVHAEGSSLVVSAEPRSTTLRSSTTPTMRSSASVSPARRGWQSAYRDAVMMKVAYAYGLRFNELRHLQTVDFARNPHAREVDRFGIIEDWLANGRGDPGTLDLFPSERGGLVVESTLVRRVRRYCAELGPLRRARPSFVPSLVRHAPARSRVGPTIRARPDRPRPACRLATVEPCSDAWIRPGGAGHRTGERPRSVDRPSLANS